MTSISFGFQKQVLSLPLLECLDKKQNHLSRAESFTNQVKSINLNVDD